MCEEERPSQVGMMLFMFYIVENEVGVSIMKLLLLLKTDEN